MLDKDTIQIKLEVSGADEVFKVLNDIKNSVKNFHQNLGQVNPTVENLEKGFKKYRKEVENLSNEFERLARLLRAEFRWIAGFEIIRGIENIIKSSFQTIIELDSALAKIKASTLASTSEMQELEKALLAIASQSTYSFKELGEALAIIVRAGVNVKDSIIFLDVASKMALITGENLEKVASFLVSVQKVYQFPTEELLKVANLITIALNQSKLALKDLIIAWQYVAPTAKTANISIKELLATMMVLSDKGLDASKIGTNLRQMFTYLIAPTSKLASIFKTLGINLNDINLLNRNFIEVLDLLVQKGFDVNAAFQGLGIRGATAFAYLLTSITEIKKALLDLNIADITNIIDQAYSYIATSISGAASIFKNQLAVSIAPLKEVIKPAILDTLSGLSSILTVFQGVTSAISGLSQNSSIQLIALSSNIALLSNVFLSAKTSSAVLAGGITFLLGVFLQLISASSNLRTSLISTTDVSYGLSMAFTYLATRGTVLGRILLGIEAGLYAIAKIGAIKKLLGLSDIDNIIKGYGEISATILDATKNTENFEVVIQKLKDSFSLLNKESQSKFPTLSTILEEYNKRGAQSAEQIFYQKFDQIQAELLKFSDIIGEQLRQKKAKILTEIEKQKRLSESEAERKEIQSHLQKQLNELNKQEEIFNRLKEIINSSLKLTIPIEQPNYSKSFQDILENTSKTITALIESGKKSRDKLSQLKDAYILLMADITNFFKKQGHELSEKEKQTIIENINKAKDLQTLQDTFNKTILDLLKIKEIPETKETKQELARILRGFLLQHSKLFEDIGKDYALNLNKLSSLKEQIQPIIENLNHLLQQEIYGLDYFNQYFARVEELRKKVPDLYKQYKTLGLQKLFEYLQKEDLQLSFKNLENIAKMIYRFELPSTILTQAQLGFFKYLEDGIQTVNDLMDALKKLSLDKTILEQIFKGSGDIDIIFKILLNKIQKFWQEGLFGSKTLIVLKKYINNLGSIFNKDLNKQLEDILINTPIQSLDDFWKKYNQLQQLYGEKSNQLITFIKSQLDQITNPAKFKEFSKVFDELLNNYDKFKESGIDIDKIFSQLVNNSLKFYNEGKVSLPILIDLYLKWLQTIQSSNAELKQTSELLQQITLQKLIEGYQQGKISLKDLLKDVEKYMQLTQIVPDYRLSLDFFKNYGKLISQQFNYLKEQWIEGQLPIDKFISEGGQIWEILQLNLNNIIKALQEGKLSYLEVLEVLRQMGPEGRQYIDQITEGLSKQQIVLEALKEAFRKYFADTQTNMEIMSSAFYDMTKALSDAFTNSFVNIMKGKFENLRDVWLNFLNTFVTIWQQALAKMLMAQLFNLLAPTFSSFFFFPMAKGGILPGSFIPFQKFAYGGIATKPTFGLIAETGKAEAVVPLPDNKHIPVQFINSSQYSQQNQQSINIINVLDPKLVGEYLATPSGQKMLLNVISLQAPKIRKLIF